MVIATGIEERMKRQNDGFTLIELMIVVVILAILFGIAIPSYKDYVRKAARAQAKAKILDIAQAEERYFTNHGTYLAFSYASPPSATGWADYAYSGGDSGSRKYEITVAAGPTGSITTSFEITAAQANSFTDPACGDLSLKSDGTKSANGTQTASCW